MPREEETPLAHGASEPDPTETPVTEMGPVRRTLKKVLVSTIPALRDLLAERDRLRIELRVLGADRDHLQVEQANLAEQLDDVRAAVNRLQTEHRVLGADRDRLQAEKANLAEQLNDVQAAVIRLQTERSALDADRDRLQAEKASLDEQLEHLQGEVKRYKTWVPPGHFYSPIPSIDEVRARERTILDRTMTTLPGIEMNQAEQLSLLDRFLTFYGEEGFVKNKARGRRYYYENDQFPYGDAFFLYCVIRHFAPKRIIEIGAGFSSAVMLDTNDRLFDGSIEFTAIEPHPQRLLSLVSKADLSGARLIEKYCQDVPVSLFAELGRNDILFIDSSHVAKTGSDVNYLVFEILPRLASGVLVHVHDVPFPFEYGEDWIYEGRAWNEAYLMRAFLQYNQAFEMLIYPSFLASLDMERARAVMPKCVDPMGPSLWLRKL